MNENEEKNCNCRAKKLKTRNARNYEPIYTSQGQFNSYFK